MKQINQYANILTLRKISSLFKTTFKNVDELLNIVLETAQFSVGSRHASLLLLDEKANKLQFYQASGKGTGQLKLVEIPQGVGLAGLVAETGEAIVSNDVQNDKRWFSKVSEMTDLNVISIASLPLILKGVIIGVVQFLDKQDDSIYSEQDLELLERFSKMMAMFFEVSRSNEILGEEFDRLQEKYRQRYTIVGESQAIRKCIAQAEKVSNSKAAILLTGDSGTGKELFAHLIHDRSLRQTKPFVS
ncbi:MAG: GAF domain-containing protein, partial [Nitrospinae bacterium]|nr:GAF domain-containing protein [Nitrospinota bacterium]